MRTFKPMLLCLAVSGGLLALALLPQRPVFATPSATTFTVDTTDDRLDDNTSDGVCLTSVNTCALRAAIMQANHLTGPGVTTIILPSGTYTLTRPASGGDGEDNGDLNLTAPLGANQTISLVGADAASTIIDANQIDRLMFIATGRTATITRLSLRNGLIVGSVGGIFNNGTLTMVDSVVSGNQGGAGGLVNNGTLVLVESTITHNTADSEGGGIYNTDSLIIIDSTISYNDADTFGGGGIRNSGSVSLSNSTLDHNTAITGGGGFSNASSDSSLSVVNSTFSQNHTDGDGGGLYSAGTANLYNTTIVYNGANEDADADGLGGGVYNYSGATLSVRNVLVAGNNVFASPTEDDCTGAMGVYGVNLLGLTDEGTSGCTISGSGVWTYLNSLIYLGELQDNGGPTWTHALLPGSNAIDGDNIFSPMACVNPDSSPMLTDQRGRSRAAGSSCDIGAFEYQLPLFLPLVVR